jgi:hypothetical protein
MSEFNTRAADLCCAIERTLGWLQHYPTTSDVGTLLTEHLALLHEAELLMLTDAQPEDDPKPEFRRHTPDPRMTTPEFAEKIWSRYDQPKAEDLANYQSHIVKSDDAVAEIRKTYERSRDAAVATLAALEYTWGGGEQWQPPVVSEPWYPDNSGEWVEVPMGSQSEPAPLMPHTMVYSLGKREREERDWSARYAMSAMNLNWRNVVAYRAVK